MKWHQIRLSDASVQCVEDNGVIIQFKSVECDIIQLNKSVDAADFMKPL